MSIVSYHVTGAVLGFVTISAAGAMGLSGCGSERAPSDPPPPSPSAAAPIEPASPAPAAKQPELTANFDVEVRVQPPHAQLVLDGKEVGRGHVALQLPRDGRTHELRIGAEGYLSERLVFADASPPREVSLQAARSAPSPAPPPARRAHPARAAAPPRANAHAPPSRVEEPAAWAPATLPSPTAPPTKPNIKIIEPEAPHVRVIE